MLQILKLSKTYAAQTSLEVRALKDVNASFNQTGFYAIIGKSGSGKSTLLHLIAGLDEYVDGSIMYRDIELKSMSSVQKTDYIQREIAIIFQDYNLIERMNVFDNLSLVISITHPDFSHVQISQKINDVLHLVGLDGYEQKNTNTLSGGEKQRLAIARALAKDAKMILADEPTGNLDEANAKNILKLLKSISHNRLVIMVTHDEENARLMCDEVLKLQDGILISNLPIESSEIKHKYQFSHHRINHRLSLNFAFNFISSQKKRLLIALLVLIISLSFVHLAALYITYDIEEASLNTFELSQSNMIDLAKDSEVYPTTSFTDTEINLFRNTFSNSFFNIAYRNRPDDSHMVNPLIQLGHTPQENLYDSLQIFKVIQTDLVNGRTVLYGQPSLDGDQVIITDYFAHQLISYHDDYKSLELDELIGKSITDDDLGVDLIIIGILETDYVEMTESIEEKKISYNAFRVKLVEEYNVFYMNSETYQGAFGFIDYIDVDRGNGITIGERFISDQYVLTQPLIGRMPITDDEIVIALNYVDLYINPSLMPSYLTNHYDEIEILLNQSLTLHFKGKQVTSKTYTITGIVDDFNTPNHFTFLVENDEYERLVYHTEDSPKEVYLNIVMSSDEKTVILNHILDENYLHISIYSDQLYTLEQGIETSSIIVLGIAVVFAIIGALLIYSFFTINMMNSQKEIGILLSLGVRKKQITEMYSMIWGMLMLIAYLISLGIGYVIAMIQNRALARYWMIVIKVFYVGIDSIILTLVFSVVYILFIVLLTLKKIVKLEPINIIRNVN